VGTGEVVVAVVGVVAEEMVVTEGKVEMVPIPIPVPVEMVVTVGMAETVVTVGMVAKVEMVAQEGVAETAVTEARLGLHCSAPRIYKETFALTSFSRAFLELVAAVVLVVTVVLEGVPGQEEAEEKAAELAKVVGASRTEATAHPEMMDRGAKTDPAAPADRWEIRDHQAVRDDHGQYPGEKLYNVF
jgi:hypothetical protein